VTFHLIAKQIQTAVLHSITSTPC